MNKRIGKGTRKPSLTLAGKDPNRTITVGRIELGDGYYALLDRHVDNPNGLIAELKASLPKLESKPNTKSKKVEPDEPS